MSKKFDDVLSKAIVDKKLMKKSALDAMLKKITALCSGEGLALHLIRQRIITEKEILDIFSEKLNIPHVNLKKIAIEKSIIEKIPVRFTGYYKFMPVKIEGRVLTIACGYPLDVKTQDEIRMNLGYEIEVVLARQADVLEMLKKHYGLGAETIEKILAQTPEEQLLTKEALEEKIEDIEKLAEDASVIKLVNQIILEAHNKRATDIHIEPYRGKIKLRYRIDSVLYDAKVPPEIKHFFSSILSRIKIMSNLNIVEHRLPQDGRAIVKIHDQTLDLRISFMPTPYGESVVIRILPVNMLFDLKKLGLLSSDLNIFEALIEKPHGIIFVTGPTGSGKTTTLYACLSKINTNERKIITIEDPVEYEMEGITQIQVMPEIGLNFVRGLRSMLRHDPDVMMVGEVRDLETAEIAIRVALTGHLVFSTLHTNDASSGITRLVDIGLEPYLVASSVEAFIAQRLVRLICPDCKEEDQSKMPELKKQIAKDINLRSADEVKIYKGAGCENCNFTGFYGRTAIYEILLVEEAIKDLVLKKASSDQIKRLAVSKGMHTLRQNGWKKVIAGLTTPDEVMKLTQAEKHKPGKTSPSQDVNEDGEKEAVSPRDKRVFARLKTAIKVYYKIIEPKPVETKKKGYEAEHIRTTQNISAGGLLFFSNEPVPLGAILELKIELPNDDTPIQCLSRVLRVEEIIEGKDYDVAVCFLDISGSERTRFNKYVQERL